MFSQNWDIPHPYRISLYDSFYSKLNEGSLMWGREHPCGSPPPFFNSKKIPQEMTHTKREEGTGPQVLRPRWLCSTCSRGGGGGRKQHGAGSWDGTTEPRRVFYSSPQYLILGKPRKERQHVSHPIQLSGRRERGQRDLCP